jgi:hypothetical protein
MKSRVDQWGTAAQMTVRTAESSSEATMIGLRPQASDSPPATSIETASRPVVRDSARLAPAALTPKSAENSGISGCTQ